MDGECWLPQRHQCTTTTYQVGTSTAVPMQGDARSMAPTMRNKVVLVVIAIVVGWCIVAWMVDGCRVKEGGVAIMKQQHRPRVLLISRASGENSGCSFCHHLR